MASKSRDSYRWGSAGRRAAAVCVVCAAVLGLCSPAQAEIERSGTLRATVTDNFLTGESTTRYILKSGKQTTVVRPTELAAEPGDRVVVTGRLRDDRLVGEVEATAASTQAAVAAGPRKVAVLLITFSGEPAGPWSPQEMHSKVFTAANSINAFYQEESYGGISLAGKLDPSGDVFGWFALNTPTAGCPESTWKNEADEAAVAAGIDLTGYQHLIYAFPWQSSCSWLGRASLGGNWSMINGDLFNTQAHVIAHELGHNLGLLHAGSWTCTSGGVRVQISDTCTITEYGDPFDTMGNIAPRHNNGWNLDKLGILAPGNVETVDASGAYSLQSALHPTPEPTVLRIPRTKTLNGNIASWYYLEVRESGGVFENVFDASTTGVSIRATAAGLSSETLLLDANPATSTFQDAPLGVGQTFDGGAVRVTTLAAGGGDATVSVELDEEPPTAPGGLTATVVGAERVQLQWGASTDDFGVHRYVVFRDGSQIGVVAGTSFTDSLASVGEHEYVVYADDMTGNRSDASEPAALTVELDEEPPTAPTGLTASAGVDGMQLQWDASTDNLSVDRYVVFRDGFEVGGSGESTSFLDSFAAAGEHTYVVYAEDETGNRSAASEPAATTLGEIEGPVCASGSCTVAFWHSGAAATWIVPAGVGAASFTVEGAQGGTNGGPSGTLFGRGARVVATLGSLTTGEAVTVSVGGMGKPYAAGGAGGFGGGGGGTLGGGGGGYSSVALGSTLMLLAGGGGGWGLSGFNAITAEERAGGRGGQGGSSGTVGAGGAATVAHGATLAGGSGGGAGGSGGAGGGGGGVTGASTCPGGASGGSLGAAGSSFTGGGGAPNAGGGGGGGYVGGGQGGSAARDACGSSAGSGGGGGGSSFAANGLSATFTGGIRRDYGRVTIAYSNPVAAANRSYTTLPDQELVVPAASGVLSGASSPSGVSLSASVVTSPAHGSLALEDDGSFTYTPASGYSGGDSFTFRATGSSPHSATAGVTLTVAEPPSASISAPPGDGTFVVGQLVPTAFSCSEGVGGTGLSSCNDSTGAKTKSGGAGSLDTSTVGAHTYTVTAVSKDGLTAGASIEYAVVPAPPPDDPDEPPTDPDEPEKPPSPPGKPPVRVEFSLGVGEKSLRELLRTRRLTATATVNKATKVALAGRARLVVRARREERMRFVEVLESKTVDFTGPGEKEVALVLTRKGREALRRLPKLRLAIAGEATDEAGEAAKRTVVVTLRR